MSNNTSNIERIIYKPHFFEKFVLGNEEMKTQSREKSLKKIAFIFWGTVKWLVKTREKYIILCTVLTIHMLSIWVENIQFSVHNNVEMLQEA